MLSQYTVIQAKLNVIYKKIEENTAYLEKNCIMNKSLKCRQKWMETKSLHKMAVKLELKLKE
tara:strand:+ start:83 stop:268 length:186 start_codon:yes stop_codon:yes gene_type:complete